MGDELEELRRQLAATQAALSREVEDVEQTKESLEREREEIRRTQEHERRLADYLQHTGLSRQEFIEEADAVHAKIAEQRDRLVALEGMLSKMLTQLPSTPAEVGQAVVANTKVSTELKQLLGVQRETVDSLLDRVANTDAGEALELAAKSNKDRINAEMAHVRETMGALQEELRAGVDSNSRDEAHMLLLSPPCSANLPTAHPMAEVATRAEKVQAVLAEWLQTETAWDEPHRETVTQQLKAAAIEYRKKEKVLATFLAEEHYEEAALLQQEMDALIKRAAVYQQKLVFWESFHT